MSGAVANSSLFPLHLITPYGLKRLYHQATGGAGEAEGHDIRLCGRYQIGEEVAVAQSYRDADVHFIYSPDWQWGCVDQMAGYKNKMFVRADLIPHRIRITDIKVELLQDISEADIMCEGIMEGETRQSTY